MLTFKQYQELAHKTAIYPTEHFEYPVIGLAGEVGELCNQVKKIIRDDGDLLTALQSSRKAKIQDEIGDILWYVAECCTKFELDMEAIAEGNLEKLAKRASEGTIQGDARGKSPE
jgi:NTP pyrophosphatase (non-canonical NTP hydrolase)